MCAEQVQRLGDDNVWQPEGEKSGCKNPPGISLLLYLLVPLETNVLAHHNAAECTHEFKGHLERLELTGQQVEALHLHKVTPNPLSTTFEVLIQHLHTVVG